MTVFGSAEIEVRADTSRFSKDAEDQVERAMSGVSSTVEKTTRRITGLLAGAFAVDKIIGFGKAGLSVAADFQQTTISFETMLGSGQKAADFLGKLRDFAAKTPFEFPELATAASSLISVGVESNKVIPIMTSLGNATAGMGTGAEGVKRATVALQQMSAAGRITGEDLNQLRDAGIPVFDLLAAATGKSKEAVAALAQQGKLGKEELNLLFKALEEGKGLERFNGLMEKQSKTLNGVISTLKDTLSNIAIDFITPYLPGMTRALQGFADLIQNSGVPALHDLVDGIGAVADRIGDKAGQIVTGFDRLADVISADIDRGNWSGVGNAIGGAIQKAISSAGSQAEKITDSIGSLFGRIDWVGLGITVGKQVPALLLGLAAGVLNFDLGSLLKGIGDHWVDILIGLVTLALTPTKVLGPIAKVLEKLPFGGVFVSAMFKTKEIAEAALKFALSAVEALGSGLLRGIGLLGPRGVESMGSVIRRIIGVVVEHTVAFFEAVGRFAQRLPEGLLSVIDDVGRVIGTTLRFIFDAYKDAAKWLFSRGVELMSGLTNGVKVEAQFLFDYFLYIPRKIFELLSTIGSWLIEHGRQLISGLRGGIDINIVDVWNFFYVTLPNRLIQALSSAGTWLLRGGAQILEGLLSGTSGVWESSVAPWFRALGGRVVEVAGNLGRVLWEAGADISRSLFGGLTSAWGTVEGWLRGIYGRVVGAVGSLGSVLLEAGKDIIRSLMSGIEAMMKPLGDKLSGVGNFIKDHKGPPDKDRVMLMPAGQLIMQGLMEGINSQRNALRSVLGDVSGDIASGPGSFGPARVNATGATAANSLAGSVFHIGAIHIANNKTLQENLDEIDRLAIPL